MLGANVRISEIILEGFKNTEYGRIEMPSTDNKDFFSKRPIFSVFMVKMARVRQR